MHLANRIELMNEAIETDDQDLFLEAEEYFDRGAEDLERFVDHLPLVEVSAPRHDPSAARTS